MVSLLNVVEGRESDYLQKWFIGGGDVDKRDEVCRLD